MRIPLACNLASRDGQVDQDAKVKNAICEIAGQDSSVRKRPGMSDYGLVKVGTAQLLTAWAGGVRSVISDTYCGGPPLPSSYTTSTTFNSSDKTTDITLSGGNLTVAASGAVNGGAVRVSASPISTGAWYFETTINSGMVVIGFTNAATVLDDWYNTGGPWYYPVSGGVARNGASLGTVGTATVGDVVGMFFDVDLKSLYIFKNGTFIGSVYSPYLTSSYCPFIGALDSTAGNVTCKFTGFTYTPSLSQVALSVTSTNQPMWATATGGTAGTSYLAFANKEYLWYVGIAGAPTKVSDTDYPGNMTPARQTVPGIVYLDTYFFVMDTAARIYNSASNDPTSWSALGFITAQNENGAGVALGKTKNYVVAFKEYSTEPFYDAANPVGSPLSPVESGFFRIGCASGASVVQWDDSLIWVSQSRSAGRAVHRMQGIENQKISTPDIDRILNADDLATVHAYCMRLEGHDLYVLTLVTSNITLVYDFTSQLWYEWSTQVAGSNAIDGEAILLTRSGSTATLQIGSVVDLNGGDVVVIAGLDQSEYNGTFTLDATGTASFTYQVTGTPATPATAAGAVTITPYRDNYLKLSKYTNFSGADLLLHESDGHLYQIDPSLHQDDGLPIDTFIRTTRLDGGDIGKKKVSRARVVGDYVDDDVYVRWSDDDSQTFSLYYQLDMTQQEPEIRRSKGFRRRSYEVKHTGNNPLRLTALELEVSK